MGISYKFYDNNVDQSSYLLEENNRYNSFISFDLNKDSICSTSTNILLVIVSLILFIGLVTMVNIIPIIIASTVNDTCDNTEPVGINSKDFLMGSGIAGLVVEFILFASIIMIIFCPDIIRALIGCVLLIVILMYMLFLLAWLIVGAVILFAGNIECINSGSPMVICALVYWCLLCLFFLAQCCGGFNCVTIKSQ